MELPPDARCLESPWADALASAEQERRALTNEPLLSRTTIGYARPSLSGTHVLIALDLDLALDGRFPILEVYRRSDRVRMLVIHGASEGLWSAPDRLVLNGPIEVDCIGLLICRPGRESTLP